MKFFQLPFMKNILSVLFVLLSLLGVLSLYGLTNGGNVADGVKLLVFTSVGLLIITILLYKDLMRLLILYSIISVIGLMAIATAPSTWFETAGVITTIGLTAASIITFFYRRGYQNRQKLSAGNANAPVEK